jgi:hypothetical protein
VQHHLQEELMTPQRVSLAAAPALVAILLVGAVAMSASRSGGAVAREQGWVVSPQPLMRLGVAAGDAAQEFGRIRGVARLSDGRVVVADGASQELRFFAATGAHVLTVGRSGAGPGEFGTLWSLLRTPGDSLITWDFRQRRATVFAAGGRVSREIRIRDGLGAGHVELIGRFHDGSLLFTRTVEPRPERSGIHRTVATYWRVGADGTGIDSLAALPGREFEVTMGGAADLWSTLDLPFARESFGAVAPDVFYVGQNDRFEIQQRARNGRVLTTIRHAPAERPLTAAEAARLEQQVFAHLEPFRGCSRDRSREAAIPRAC